MQIPIDQIFDRRKVNRRGIDPEHVRALAEDFQRNGQLQPIAVRRADDGTWDLVAGRNRLEAAKALAWTEISAHDTGIKSGVEAAALAENVKRANLSPVEESDQLVYMQQELDLSIGALAELTGHGNSWVQDRLALASYPDNIKQSLHERKISLGAANMLMLIENQEHRDWCLHLARVNGATVHQCEAWYLDWKSREALLNPPGYDGQRPQPLPPPTSPIFACFLCETRLPSDELLVMRVCIGCHDDVQRMKINPLTQTALVAQDIETRAKSTHENAPPNPKTRE